MRHENPQKGEDNVLAIHYFKGDEIDQDLAKGKAALRKAKEAGYVNAILIDAMIAELESTIGFGKGFNDSRKIENELKGYAGINFGRRGMAGLWFDRNSEKSILASIRAEYEKAFAAGANAATNQIARIDARIKAEIEERKKEQEAKDAKSRNAKLAEGLL